MSAEGCGLPLAGSDYSCGDVPAIPGAPRVLCPTCQRGQFRCECSALPCICRPAEWERMCEGCREVPATRTRSPYLCNACEAEYAADMAAGDVIGDPGSRCHAGCGYCGRCGGA